jgi:hypothetical protein
LSWTIVSPAFSTAATTSSRLGFTNTPTTSQRRRSAAPISAAAAGSHLLGLSP